MTIIRNAALGIGDAVNYCWLIHSLRAHGVKAKFQPRRHYDIFPLLSVPPSWIVPGSDDEKTFAPAKGRRDGPGWLRHWLAESSCPDAPLTRPTYSPAEPDIAWARQLWADRDKATSSARRVLIFPEAAWPNRIWPKPFFIDLAYHLLTGGYDTVVCTQYYNNPHPWPWSLGGLSIPHFFALISQAHLVVGNDSGPAVIAATLGVPTLTVSGPTPASIYHEHLPEIEEVTLPEAIAPCIGCNFEHSRGYRISCDHGCSALHLTPPTMVKDAIVKAFESPFNGKATTHIAPDFAEKLTELAAGRVCVETGTYDGVGSTAALAKSAAHVHTIECNPARWRSAFLRYATVPSVTCHLGLTLNRAIMLNRPAIKQAITHALEICPGAIMEGSTIDSAIDFYLAEVDYFGDENVLPRLINSTRPGLVLLDSAGSGGWFEYLAVRDLIPPGCYLALDDTVHIKHALTVRALDRQADFRLVWSSPTRNGSAIYQKKE